MSELKITQRRYTSYAGGITKYHIELTVAPGTTPSSPPMSSHVFVQTIGAAVANDAFARVATLADLDLTLDLRSTAVTLGHTEYRVATVTVTYNDLDTAIAAIPVITDRVDSLTDTWVKARAEFVINADVTTLPTAAAGASVKGGYKTAYTDANALRTTAEAAQATQQSTFETAQSAVDAARDLNLVHCDYKTQFAKLKGVEDSTSSAPALNPALALQSALSALNAAADQFGKLTRGENGKSGVVAHPPGTATNPELGLLIPISDMGKLLAITFADEGGVTEIRAILAANETNPTVKPAFNQVPTGGDVWRIYALTDTLPSDDFGRSAAAATKAQAALTVYQGSEGLQALLTNALSDATQKCNDANAAHKAALSAEATARDAVEAAQADVLSAQSAEDAAAADLVGVCPDVDLTTLQ